MTITHLAKVVAIIINSQGNRIAVAKHKPFSKWNGVSLEVQFLDPIGYFHIGEEVEVSIAPLIPDPTEIQTEGK